MSNIYEIKNKIYITQAKNRDLVALRERIVTRRTSQKNRGDDDSDKNKEPLT
jgi:hypothetical protein